jgi:hypothetical protein
MRISQSRFDRLVKELAMLSLSSTGFEITLGVVALVVLLLVAKMFTGKPKRAEKWEKAEIMKQLLALSEQEEGRRVTAPAVRVRPQAARPGQAQVKATARVAVGARKGR